ncbi:MAG: cation diffusion facilitator family transporter [Candidatus Acetothermia bacterium]|jgi:cation diffusion facilitator family transporter|nr:cation diffusion facilitator family transporter [Candidatus Acetothermia bacterium]
MAGWRDEGLRITLIGVGINLVLTGLKFGVGFLSGSMALVADGVHSLSDMATDLVVIGGLRLARRPADRSHAYGHGKFETLATTLVALALVAAGGWLAWEAVAALLRGGMSAPGPAIAGVAAMSVLSKEWLFRATRRVARRLRSSALEANAWHHRSDALSSVAVLCGGGVAALGFAQGDQAATIAVAVLIGWAAVGILRKAVYELTEGALSEAEQGKVARAITGVDGVKSWHKLRTRSVGRGVFVDVHIEVDPTISVQDSHAIASQVEQAVRGALSGEVSVAVHVEPAGEDKDA